MYMMQVNVSTEVSCKPAVTPTWQRGRDRVADGGKCCKDPVGIQGLKGVYPSKAHQGENQGVGLQPKVQVWTSADRVSTGAACLRAHPRAPLGIRAIPPTLGEATRVVATLQPQGAETTILYSLRALVSCIMAT
jgi:hypothetical protein